MRMLLGVEETYLGLDKGDRLKKERIKIREKGKEYEYHLSRGVKQYRILTLCSMLSPVLRLHCYYF